ncbi:BON domain-containing protein [Horticoccus luteus]|uniref:BON domain-containing protein n=1 Tax=Horticoccus luteus TaxID=2862869 RepID=A0A8F9TU39_9BACT|nr:BON domain-containing protein [Horticoccus luteus]QYM78051.1 BON domain-containing protein [Horticoccus luteus]
MKKFTLLLTAVSSLLVLGCSKKNDGYTTTTTNNTMSDTTAAADHDMRTAGDKVADASRDAADKVGDAAHKAGDAIQDKLQDWHLTGDDIKADLRKSGEVVRSKSSAAAASTSSAFDTARITSTINAKYATDSGLSMWKIDVDTNKDVVTLTGSVDSPEQIGRAIAIALNTDGVRQVVSKLVVKNNG